MKLLVITQKYDINDSNLGAFNIWWDKLAAKVEKVYILALEKISEPTLSNMKVVSMGKENGIGFFGKILRFYKGLFQTIGKTDAILVHMIPKYVILAVPIAILFRKPIYFWYAGVAAQRQLNFAVLFCRKVFTSHEAGMRVDTKKCVVIGHGIDTEKFKIQDRKYKINEPIGALSIGRITPSKGHKQVIEAIVDLIQQGYNLKLKIIGGVIQERHEVYFRQLKKLAIESGLVHSIEFIGPVSYWDMPEYFKKARILINAVPYGSLDKVVLEAMASGIIPLTSNSAFLMVFPKFVAQSLVFKDGDVEDLKIKLKYILEKKLYQNEVLRCELRNIVVKNYNIDNLISKIAMEMGE